MNTKVIVLELNKYFFDLLKVLRLNWFFSILLRHFIHSDTWLPTLGLAAGPQPLPRVPPLFGDLSAACPLRTKGGGGCVLFRDICCSATRPSLSGNRKRDCGVGGVA